MAWGAGPPEEATSARPLTTQRACPGKKADPDPTMNFTYRYEAMFQHPMPFLHSVSPWFTSGEHLIVMMIL